MATPAPRSVPTQQAPLDRTTGLPPKPHPQAPSLSHQARPRPTAFTQLGNRVIDSFYNPRRIQEHLGYLSAIEYEESATPTTQRLNK